jgi:hypothetical protein
MSKRNKSFNRPAATAVVVSNVVAEVLAQVEALPQEVPVVSDPITEEALFPPALDGVLTKPESEEELPPPPTEEDAIRKLQEEEKAALEAVKKVPMTQEEATRITQIALSAIQSALADSGYSVEFRDGNWSSESFFAKLLFRHQTCLTPEEEFYQKTYQAIGLPAPGSVVWIPWSEDNKFWPYQVVGLLKNKVVVVHSLGDNKRYTFPVDVIMKHMYAPEPPEALRAVKITQ